MKVFKVLAATSKVEGFWLTNDASLYHVKFRFRVSKEPDVLGEYAAVLKVNLPLWFISQIDG